jgi:hypothetical protein
MTSLWPPWEGSVGLHGLAGFFLSNRRRKMGSSHVGPGRLARSSELSLVEIVSGGVGKEHAGREAPMNGYSHIQWKVAMARMQDANRAAATIAPTYGALSQRATRTVAEQQLNRYFELVEADLNYHRKQSTRPT